MKKLLSALLCVLLMCTMIAPAYADGSVQISITPSATTVQRGDEVTFTVSVSGSAACTQYGLQLSYDETVFEMVGGTNTVTGALVADFTPSRGFAVLYSAATEPSGQLGTFTLRVKDDATFGSTQVGGKASAKNGTETVEASAGGVSVSVSCSHTYGAWEKADDAEHQCTCSACGDVKKEAHSWDAGQVTTPADCKNPGEATYTCTACGAVKTDAVPVTDHSYGAWTAVDEAQHKRICDGCGNEEVAAHNWDDGQVIKEANCKEAGDMRYTCADCGASRLEQIPQSDTHTYDNQCDPDCNICGATRTITHDYSSKWKSDKNGHWHVCKVCGDKTDAAAHTPGAPATESKGQICTVCSYMIAAPLGHKHDYSDKLSADENGHWYDCSGCDGQKDYAAHAFDNGCDEKCDVCGYQRTVQHKMGVEWANDGASHWHVCAECGLTADTAEHTWQEGKCSVCGAVDPAFAPDTAPDAAPDATPEGEPKKKSPLPFVIGGVAVVAAAGAAVFMVLKKKKTKA